MMKTVIKVSDVNEGQRDCPNLCFNVDLVVSGANIYFLKMFMSYLFISPFQDVVVCLTGDDKQTGRFSVFL